jgi:hypothetical protein
MLPLPPRGHTSDAEEQHAGRPIATTTI